MGADVSRKEIQQLIKRAEAAGWEYLGFTGGDHHRVRWPATGDVITMSATPGHRATAKAEADLARISGPLREKPGPGRSKAERAAARRRAAENTARTPRPTSRQRVKARPPEWKEKLQQVAEELSRPPRFIAVCACPDCGTVAVHWLRPPQPDETDCEVVRQCRHCDHEWRQR